MGRAEMLAGARPFALEGARDEAVLCIHGFTGSPGVYRKLAPALNAQGFSVLVPLLPGHASEPADMAAFGADDWLAAVEEAYQHTAERFSAVHLVGLSLGGALACRLAARHPEIRSLTLLAPCFAVNPKLLARIGITIEEAARSERLLPLPTRQPTGGEMDECIFGYDAVPLRALAELQRAGTEAREICPGIRVPALIAYTTADLIVDPAETESAAAELPSLEQKVCFPQSEHNLLFGVDREKVAALTCEYLLRHGGRT